MDFDRKSYILTIKSHKLIFQALGSNERDVVLNFGYGTVADSYFNHNIPTEAEIDYAINFIEDELETGQGRFGEKGELHTSSTLLAAVFRKNDYKNDSFSRKGVEKLFSAYARVMMGSPSSSLPSRLNRKDVAILLIIREIMHHLDFETLKITQTGK